MRKLVENCVHSFVKNPMNFMNLKSLLLQPVTLPAAPRGAAGKWGAGRRPDGGDLKEKTGFYRTSGPPENSTRPDFVTVTRGVVLAS